jgi:hypothetical protein
MPCRFLSILLPSPSEKDDIVSGLTGIRDRAGDADEPHRRGAWRRPDPAIAGAFRHRPGGIVRRFRDDGHRCGQLWVVPWYRDGVFWTAMTNGRVAAGVHAIACPIGLRFEFTAHRGENARAPNNIAQAPERFRRTKAKSYPEGIRSWHNSCRF